MGSILRLRAFETKDMPKVLQLANAYAAFDQTIREADFIPARFFPNGFWIAEEDNKIVGYVWGYFKDAPIEALTRWGASKVGYIASMAVDMNYRNKGIGTALLSKLLEEFKKAGADLVKLHCPAIATDAKKLYDKLGFNVGAYYMERRLHNF